MVMPAWPPTTGTLTSSGLIPSTSACQHGAAEHRRAQELMTLLRCRL